MKKLTYIFYVVQTLDKKQVVSQDFCRLVQMDLYFLHLDIILCTPFVVNNHPHEHIPKGSLQDKFWETLRMDLKESIRNIIRNFCNMYYWILLKIVKD